MAGPVLDHIGIAVRSIDSVVAIYEAIGFELDRIEEVAGQKVRVGFLAAGESCLELLEPTDATSPIARHLERRGPGLHHICLRVTNVRAAMAALTERGLRVLSDEPLVGAHGNLVCFVHPAAAEGVLIELSQPAVEVDD